MCGAHDQACALARNNYRTSAARSKGMADRYTRFVALGDLDIKCLEAKGGKFFDIIDIVIA